MLTIQGDTHNRDFFFEMQKHSMHLRAEFFARQMAIYEIYKQTIDLPGSVAEFGVRNGANFFFLARMIELFNSGRRYDGLSSRHLFGFDTFSGLTSIADQDRSQASWFDMKEGGILGDRDTFFHDLEVFKKDYQGAERLHAIEGNIMETWPKFLEDQPGVRFSLVYFDIDLYEPTKLVLESIWDKCVPGAIIVFDEYGLREFPGESQAVDEFFANRSVKFESVPWCYCPTMFVRKS